MKTSFANPYLDLFVTLPEDPLGGTRRDHVAPLPSRRDLVGKFAWAVPSEEAILAIVDLGEPTIEVGAGTGYWSSLVQAAGGDVIAFDSDPTDQGANHWHGMNPPHMPITKATAAEAIRANPRPVLFLCWPPYADPMGADALIAHSETGGRFVVYVGEGAGGCTGDDRMHAFLGESPWCCACDYPDGDDEHALGCGEPALFVQRGDSISIPQWWGIHDYMTIYEAPKP